MIVASHGGIPEQASSGMPGSSAAIANALFQVLLSICLHGQHIFVYCRQADVQRGPTLGQCQAGVDDAGPTLTQRWVKVQPFLGHPACGVGAQTYRGRRCDLAVGSRNNWVCHGAVSFIINYTFSLSRSQVPAFSKPNGPAINRNRLSRADSQLGPLWTRPRIGLLWGMNLCSGRLHSPIDASSRIKTQNVIKDLIFNP